MARRQAARSCDIGRPISQKVFGRVACVVPCMARQGRGPDSSAFRWGPIPGSTRPGRGPDAPVAAVRFGVPPLPSTRGEVTDGRQPVPTHVGRVRAAARPHLSCGLPSRRGGVTDGRQPVPTVGGRVRAAARHHLSCGLPPRRGEVTDGRQPVPTHVGRVRAAARPHLTCGSRSGDLHDSEVAADLRDHGLLGEEPEPDAEASSVLRAAHADLLGQAHGDLPPHHLD